MRFSIIASILFVALILQASVISAGAPQLVNYQGRLTDSDGIPLDGDYSIAFTIYDDPMLSELENIMWQETHASVTTTDGLFSILLGSETQLDESIFGDTLRYLGIKVGEDPEITPRTRIVTVAYAFHAVKSDTAAFAFLIADNAVTSASIQDGSIAFEDIAQNGAAAGQIMKWEGGAWVADDDETGGTGWNWSDSSSHGPDSVLFADSSNHADSSDYADSAGFADSSLYADSSDYAESSGFSDSTEAVTDGAVDFADIGDNGATENQIMKWNGLAWIAANDETGGGNGWVDDGNFVRLETINDSVGIGTSTPSAKLDIVGDVVASGKATIGTGHTNTGLASFVAGENNSIISDRSTIGGGFGNQIEGEEATIGGGLSNTADGDYATIGGGHINSALSDSATVCGGAVNTASGRASFVGGGANDTASGEFAVVSGGNSNHASGSSSTVGGGAGNIAGIDSYTTVSGGSNNMASGLGSTVGGGKSSVASGIYATVGGGRSNTASGDSATVAGGAHNLAEDYGATVGGGASNKARGQYSVVSGGGGETDADSNSALGNHSTIGGGNKNTASHGATVGGGIDNHATGQRSTIAGGLNCEAIGDYSVVGGGLFSEAGGNYATCSGGNNNFASGNAATCAGGDHNYATGDSSAVGGGYSNNASGTASTVAGGQSNIANVTYTTVGGGHLNEVYGIAATIAGGEDNNAIGFGAFVGGGQINSASGLLATVAGGYNNTATDTGATVSGGRSNDAAAVNATVCGGRYNEAGHSAAVCGGYENLATGVQSFIGGGENNTATDTGTTVSGGRGNDATARDATVCGGLNNEAGHSAVVGGGIGNHATGTQSFIGGGGGNEATVQFATICGGWQDTASGVYSMIVGGRENKASGYGSFASGRRAKAIHDGAFVWADYTNADFTSTGSDQFLIRASGGVGIGSNSPGSRALDVTNQYTGGFGQMVNLESTSDPSSSNDVLQIKAPSTAPDNFQFIECERGTDPKFRVHGNGDVTADGSVSGGGADLAEMVRVSTGHFSVEAGDVMVIDPANTRAIVKASEPRSTLVAGIYSTNPGFVASQHDWDNIALQAGYNIAEDREVSDPTILELAASIEEIPLAVVGIVPCKVTNENGPIQPGDLLVTSSTPGHAMRDDNPKPGTILGKALEPLASGSGLIRVLVTMQ